MPNPCSLYTQKWTLVSAVGMSGKGEKRTSPCSFDHLIGALLEMYGHVKAKRLSGFQIDHQLEFDWSLHGKLACFFALKNAIKIRRGAPKIIGQVISVGQQAAEFSEDTSRSPVSCLPMNWPMKAERNLHRPMLIR